jgi:hypothetical protein
MTDKEAMKLSLDALEYMNVTAEHRVDNKIPETAITALKERLADPMREVQRLGQEIEQEPYCFVYKENGEEFFAPKDGYFPADATPLYNHPPQPEQEPVAWMWDVKNGGGYTSRGVGLYQTDIPFARHTPLFTRPPQEGT